MISIFRRFEELVIGIWKMGIKIKKAIRFIFVFLVVITTLLVSTVAVVTLSHDALKAKEKDMYYALRLIDNQIDYQKDLKDQIIKLNNITYTKESRLTIIDLKGNVLADSLTQDQLDNHLTRTEVREAIRNKVGYATRYSKTAGRNLIYVAYRTQGYILRLALPYQGVFENAHILIQPLLFAFVGNLLVALALAYYLLRTLGDPLTEISGELNLLAKYQALNFPIYRYQELNDMTRKLQDSSESIADQIKQLSVDNETIMNVLNQMEEGFILVDKDLKIIIVNKKVKAIYNTKMEVGHRVTDYIFDYQVVDAIKGVTDETRVVDLTRGDYTYRCFINKVDYGLAILFIDVSFQIAAEKVRADFFSNVSHELKTPMTSIKGYSELLQAGMIPDEAAKQKAYHQIFKEVEKMISLVEDILMISRLENKDVEVIQNRIDIQEVVDDILMTNKLLIEEKGLSVIKEIKAVYYEANYQYIYQLFSNLITNAIKYNKEKGTITIISELRGNDYVFEVRDTGIGISLANQNRVFERFFRCDSGRDKLTGGTGLGLSIVKHIVQYYQGNVILNSKLGQGTSVKVVLPNNPD